MARPRLDDAPLRLLTAGLELFARRGCERVDSNAIARAAGLGVGTFYLHFANKYALLRELQLRTLAGLQHAREAAVAAAGPDPALQIRAAITAAVDFASRHPEAYRVCLGRERVAAARSGPAVAESTRALATALAGLQADGRLDPGLDVELAARAYLASEAGLLLHWLEDRTRATPERLIETLFALHPARAARTPRD